MAAAIDLRSDIDRDGLRRLARASKDGPQVRRLLALAAIYDGHSRGEAARIGSVGLQIVRDWVVQFNKRGADGLVDGKAPGAEPLLSAEKRLALFRTIEAGPILASHGVVRWRLIDLAQRVWDEFGITISKQTLSRELREAGYRKLSARPRHHAQDDDTIPAFKKAFPAQLAEVQAALPRGAPLEIWWQDDARVGPTNGITRRLARRGTRPSAPKDQRTKSGYIYGAICPGEGKGGRARAAPLQYRGYDASPRRDLRHDRARCARRAAARRSRLTWLRCTHSAAKHHADTAAVEGPRT